jgi:hypothetical protein
MDGIFRAVLNRPYETFGIGGKRPNVGILPKIATGIRMLFGYDGI